MNTDIMLFSNSDIVLIVLASLMILGRLSTFIVCKIQGHSIDSANMGTLLRNQPWILALLVLLTFLVETTLAQFPYFAIGTKAYFFAHNGITIFRAVLNIWLFFKEAKAIYLWLDDLAEAKPLLKSLLPYVKNSLYYIFVILAFPFIIPDFIEYPVVGYIIDKATTILIIWAIAWLIIQIIGALEKATLQKFDNSLEDFSARRIYTQVRVFKRIAFLLVFILAIAATAMAFENIRQLGTSILASAGLATVILGFAAQKALGNLFIGMQVAITQPIRINDTIIIENEFGTVEEISLTHVVLRIWDLRRLVVPINYFIEKPFQNFTRTSTDLLCPIFFHVDYNLPVEPVRQKFLEILKASEHWDGRVGKLEVVETDGNVMKIRALASVKNAGGSWNLKCEVLEKLIEFIVQNYPKSLPKMRNLNTVQDPPING